MCLSFCCVATDISAKASGVTSRKPLRAAKKQTLKNEHAPITRSPCPGMTYPKTLVLSGGYLVKVKTKSTRVILQKKRFHGERRAYIPIFLIRDVRAGKCRK